MFGNTDLKKSVDCESEKREKVENVDSKSFKRRDLVNVLEN